MTHNNTTGKIYIAGNQVCMKRGLDTNRMKRYFEANGCAIIESPADADTIVAVTCAFVGSYVETATAMIKSLQSYPARLIVVGCLPAMAPAPFQKVFHGDFIITRDFDKMDDLFPAFTVPYASIPDALTPDTKSMTPYSPESDCPTVARNSITKETKPPVILRIGEGCNNACSYCSHPRALGRIKSKPLTTCVSDYRRILRNGHNAVSIHANDPGAYGIDIGSSYPELLRILNKETGATDIKWALCDISPKWLLKYRKDLCDIVTWKQVVSLGVPLQSGSPRILKLMNRPHLIDDTVEVLRELRDISPDLTLTSHLIAGFPSETLEDMEKSVDVVRNASVKSVYLFRFSANVDTRASRLPGTLSPEEITERQQLLSARLTELGVKVSVFR